MKCLFGTVPVELWMKFQTSRKHTGRTDDVCVVIWLGKARDCHWQGLIRGIPGQLEIFWFHPTPVNGPNGLKPLNQIQPAGWRDNQTLSSPVRHWLCQVSFQKKSGHRTGGMMARINIWVVNTRSSDFIVLSQKIDKSELRVLGSTSLTCFEYGDARLFLWRTRDIPVYYWFGATAITKKRRLRVATRQTPTLELNV